MGHRTKATVLRIKTVLYRFKQGLRWLIYACMEHNVGFTLHLEHLNHGKSVLKALKRLYYSMPRGHKVALNVVLKRAWEREQGSHSEHLQSHRTSIE